MYQSDLDIASLREKIAVQWETLSGEPLTTGSLEWAYREVLILIASWAKIDTEKAIAIAYESYQLEVAALPYGAANKSAIIALSKAYADVADVNIAELATPSNIQVFLLAKSGSPTIAQITGLQDYLNSPEVANVCDTYTVAAAIALTWNFNAVITVSGDPIALQLQATAAVATYATSKIKLGATIKPSDLIALLRAIGGIEDAIISAPISNVSTANNEFPILGTLTITTTI